MESELFGPDPWRDDIETHEALRKKLEQIGLQKHSVGENVGGATALGLEHDLTMLTVFLGHHAIDEMPWILEERDFIDSKEMDRIYELFEAGVDIKPILLSIVRRAYFDFYGGSQSQN